MGEAIAPTAIANGSRISQNKQQQQHELIYLANAQGATMTPIALVNAIPAANITANPIIKTGTSKHSAISPSKALGFDMV